MKKLKLKKTTVRILVGDELDLARGGLVTTDGQTQSCADTCGCPAPPAPSGHYTCLASCVVCWTL